MALAGAGGLPALALLLHSGVEISSRAESPSLWSPGTGRIIASEPECSGGPPVARAVLGPGHPVLAASVSEAGSYPSLP